MRDIGICIFGAVIAISGYLTIGEFGRADNPIAERHNILMTKDVTELSPSEITVRLQKLISERPNDPEPHFFLGQQLELLGRTEDAVQAYLAALRRNPQHVNSFVALGDIEMRKTGGKVTEPAMRVYQRAYMIDSSQTAAGFKVGLALWQNKRFDEANAFWNEMEKQIHPETSASKSLQAWIAYVKANSPSKDRDDLVTSTIQQGENP